MVDGLLKWLHRVVTQPGGELSRWHKTVRFCYDLGRFGYRQLTYDRAQYMAAALSFRTLFSLLPVMVVGMLMVKGLIGVDQFLTMTDDLLASLGLDTLRVIPAQGAAGQSVVLSDWLKNLFGQAAAVNLTASTWVGIGVTLYAAISLMVTIENCFNIIVRAPRGRRWLRRLPLYWFVLTVSPLAVALWYYVNFHFDAWIASVDAWQWLLYLIWLFWNLFSGWLGMFAIYTLVPSSPPRLRPAAIGAAVSAVLLLIGLKFFGAYVNNLNSIGQLYGSLGLIPLFMFCIYLLWLGILFGLEVSVILQTLPGHRLEELEQKRQTEELVDPVSVLSVMAVIGERFERAQPTTLFRACELTGLPESAVSRMFDELVESRLLHRLDGPDETVSLAKSPDQIDAADLLEVAYQLIDRGDMSRQASLLPGLRQVQQKFVAGSTLAELIRQRQSMTA